LEQLPDGRWRLRFTRTLPHPPEKVWRAVTEPEHLARWFPTTIEGERSSGAPLRFSFPRAQAEPFTGEMLAYDEGSAMELSWGGDIVRLELREHRRERLKRDDASAIPVRAKTLGEEALIRSDVEQDLNLPVLNDPLTKRIQLRRRRLPAAACARLSRSTVPSAARYASPSATSAPGKASMM